MNKLELARILEQSGFRKDYYDLEGGLLDNRLTLAIEGERWCVYHSERGLKLGIMYFHSESDACQEILARLHRDPTAKDVAARRNAGFDARGTNETG